MFKWNSKTCRKTSLITAFILLVFSAFSQSKGLVLGRSLHLPDAGKNVEISFLDSLSGHSLKPYSFVLIFSSAHSRLSPANIAQLQEFVHNGGGLYIGADNWPFLEESNQLTFALYGKYCWGDQDPELAEVNAEACSNKVFTARKDIPSGQTTVSFPLDYRLKVEAWAGDEPLVLSGKFGKGKVVLDGGYSRFNTDLFVSEEAAEIFKELIAFLAGY